MRAAYGDGAGAPGCRAGLPVGAGTDGEAGGVDDDDWLGVGAGEDGGAVGGGVEL